ncbi:hypothetical protein PENTCL1PPCAC_29590, partial [Pristionchus entomophagus]
ERGIISSPLNPFLFLHLLYFGQLLIVGLFQSDGSSVALLGSLPFHCSYRRCIRRHRIREEQRAGVRASGTDHDHRQIPGADLPVLLLSSLPSQALSVPPLPPLDALFPRSPHFPLSEHFIDS